MYNHSALPHSTLSTCLAILLAHSISSSVPVWRDDSSYDPYDRWIIAFDWNDEIYFADDIVATVMCASVTRGGAPGGSRCSHHPNYRQAR